MRDPEVRLHEAMGLAEALGLTIGSTRTERLRDIRAGLYFGEGKADELGALADAVSAGVIYVDATLSAIQQRNLERHWQAKVIDRSGVILEIFGLRARTREGKLQVELARLNYERSRLVRTWTHLERQRGGFGLMGGPGERQLELDKRLIKTRVERLTADLDDVRRTRRLQRVGRAKGGRPVLALVGYTNAGKSTLFNALTGAGAFAKNMPFATLDPLMRLVKLPNGREAVLADTVGFITDLPTQLIAAFRATLEEVAEAQLLIHVMDASSPEMMAQRAQVLAIVDEILEGHDAPPKIIEVWNKVDQLEPEEQAAMMARAELSHKQGDGALCFAVSAVTGLGLEALQKALAREIGGAVSSLSVHLEAADGAARAWLYQQGAVVREVIDEAGDLALEVAMDLAATEQFLRRFPSARLSQSNTI